MLAFSGVSLRRGRRELLKSVSVQIHTGKKVGLTGGNGVGKSSLFALIRGRLEVDAGEFSVPMDWVIAHVAQETAASSLSALDYVLLGDEEYTDVQKQLVMADQANAGTRLAELHERLHIIDGYTAHARAGRLLRGLGFSVEQEQQAVNEFSGGWRMRLNLAQALMCRSDLLLLDEPTNHLDLDAVLWLQDWLKNYAGTLLLISHDRDFLDAVVDQIAHIEQQGIVSYNGNYSAFELYQAERQQTQAAAYRKQQREIAHMEDFVRRFKAKATKARQAQSRIRALERMEKVTAAHVHSPFQFRFAQPEKLPERLLRLDKVSLGYGEQTILGDIEFELLAGQRVGLIGPNGAGKSTLTRCLAGELSAQRGELWQAKYLQVGYFAQHQLEQLQLQASPLQHLQRLDRKAREQDLRDFLGRFGFRRERVEQAVAPFSGGEKARLVLALLVYQKPNVLLLDEPTNHLDLEMRYALSYALQDFVGALVVVSHDRYLLRSVCNELVLVAHERVEPFEGDLNDYALWLKSQRETALKGENSCIYDTVSDKSQQNKRQKRQEEANRRKKNQPLRRRVQQLEKQINTLQTEQQQLENELADPKAYDNFDQEYMQNLFRRKADLESQLSLLEAEWLEASEEYEASL